MYNSTPCAVTNGEMNREDLLRAYVLENIDRAVAEGWIKPYYQAIARTTTTDICGEEALARWIDPTYGLLLPAQFISILDQAAIAYKLNLHMIDCVLGDLCAKRDLGISIVPVSVNFSTSDLAQFDIASELLRRAEARGIDHRLLVVEFTESAASSNSELFRKQVRTLREAGFKVWLDDFGSGPSSLNVLWEYDFDLIKLDVSLVRGLVGDRAERTRIVVKGILQSASRMGLDSLAEGVETDEQALFLQNAGCGMLQGFLLSRPRPLEDVLKATGKTLCEAHKEVAYWDAIGRASLGDLCEVTAEREASVTLLTERPMGVVELRGGQWRVLRANDAYRVFLRHRGLLTSNQQWSMVATVDANPIDPEFLAAASRAVTSKMWERVAGSLERGTGYQFYMKHLASSVTAEAFAIATVPTLPGYALGGFGDVPVAYAVFRVILDDAREKVIDMVYAYANEIYEEWLGVTEEELVGRSFLKAINNASEKWLSYCYRSATLGETVHDVAYSPEVGHWLSFNIAPCSIEGYCVFAFSLADTEQLERNRLAVSLDTSELIIDIADTFSGESSYDVAMNRLLAALSRIAHARRVSLIERGEDNSGVAFEWCGEGVTPLINVMQGLKNVEFAAWERLTVSEPLIIVSDVNDSEGVDKAVLEQLRARGVTHMMVVPVRSDGVSLGYLVVDNYELDDDVDVIRLMESVASFVAARMVNHHLVGELKRASLQDALTGILNRRGIDLAINKCMAQDPYKPYVLVLMDIDDFKIVNDVYGHDMGDEALRTLARVITESFPREAIVGRNGGDEFLVLLYGYELDQAERMIRDLLTRDLSCTLGNRQYHLSVSVGYACYPSQADDFMAAYSKADKALYAVKLKGKSGHLTYSPDMERQYRSQLGFTPRDIAANVPGAIVVCRLSDNWEILFANDETLRLFECDDLTEFMRLTEGALASVVHPDDIRRVRQELGAQIRQGNVGEKVFANYRVLTKNKTVRHVFGSGRLVEVDGLGKIFYELLVDIDECRSAGTAVA